MSFELTNEFPVALQAKDKNNQVQDLVHVFRPPNESELMTYERMLPDWELKRGGKAAKKGSRYKAALYLWNACIVRVEGYSLPGGQDLMTCADWKVRLNVITHKVDAVEGLYAAWRKDSDEDDPFDEQSAEPSNGDDDPTDAQE